MALLKSISTPYGTANYHVIGRISFNHTMGDPVEIFVRGYASEDHRHEEGAKWLSENHYTLDSKDDMLTDEAIQANAYEWLKTQPEWKDAKAT